MNVRVAIGALAAAGLCLGAWEALAWKQTKVPSGEACLAWQPREIAWSPAAELGGGGLDQDEALEAFRRSFAEWEKPDCTDLRFVEEAPTGRTIGFHRGKPNQNVMLFRDRACDDVVDDDDPCHASKSCAEAHDCWDFDDRLIAVTTVTFSRCSGEILDADIEINAAAFRFTTGDGPPCESEDQRDCVSMDVQNTMVHEIGHLIGLDHSPRKDAAMYANASIGETIKRRLSEDDEKAVCTIYPVGGPARTCGGIPGDTDCAPDQHQQSSGMSCASQGGAGAAGALLLGVALGIERVGRRRRARFERTGESFGG